MEVVVNLEFLRKQAKALLKAYRAGDPRAVARIRAQIPRPGTEIKLADVHHALARELGQANWAALKHENAPLEHFLIAVRGGALKEAQDTFAEFPEMADESIHAACALGDVENLGHHLDLDTASLSSEHRGWPPLFYACASPFLRASGRQSAGILGCVRLPLDRGADPNTSVSNGPQDPHEAMSAAYRAMVSANMPVMMELVKRGARLDIKEDLAKLRDERSAWTGMFNVYFQIPAVREIMAKRIEEMRKDPGNATWGRCEMVDAHPAIATTISCRDCSSALQTRLRSQPHSSGGRNYVSHIRHQLASGRGRSFLRQWCGPQSDG